MPSIRVNLDTISAEDLIEQQTIYMNNAEVYSDSFTTLLENREYVSNIFIYDLSAEKTYLTKQGINKAENKINLHVKTDNIFNVAKRNYNFSSSNSVSNIIANVENLYTELVLSDDKTTSAFTITDNDYNGDVTYDSKSLTLTFGENTGLIFLNTIPNVIGTTQQIFGNYTSELDASTNLYTNKLQYSAEYMTNYSVASTTIQNVWVIKNSEGVVEYYTTSNILDSTATVEWTAVVSE